MQTQMQIFHAFFFFQNTMFFNNSRVTWQSTDQEHETMCTIILHVHHLMSIKIKMPVYTVIMQHSNVKAHRQHHWNLYPPHTVTWQVITSNSLDNILAINCQMMQIAKCENLLWGTPPPTEFFVLLNIIYMCIAIHCFPVHFLASIHTQPQSQQEKHYSFR